MAYRMIQWGTGNVGKHALRTIVERPDFELVGVRVYDPAKVGQDAGRLLGRAPLGVVATDDTEAILALDADCVCYAALGSTLGSAESPLNDICRLLASGKNVVSSAVEYHAYLRPGVELEGAGRNAYERLSEACEKGQTSFFHVGINPGFAMDLWPMTLSRVCRRIDQLKVVEIVDMRRYTSIHMVRDVLGFGMPPDHVTPVDRRMRDVHGSPYYLSLRTLADAIGVELEGVEYHREVAVADRDLSITAGTIERGTVAAIKFWFDGMLRGRPVITLECVWRVTNEVAPDWPAGESRWILRIDGDPSVDSEIRLATTEDAGRATSLAVATLLLNSVPTVVGSPPGLLDNRTLAPHAGGYFAAAT